VKITLQINTRKGQSFCCCERGVQLNSAIGERGRERFLVDCSHQRWALDDMMLLLLLLPYWAV
jgi:hypothetical protein